MTPPTIPPIGTPVQNGCDTAYIRKVTPAWTAKRLRRHAGAPARVKARDEATKKRQEDAENFRRRLEKERAAIAA